MPLLTLFGTKRGTKRGTYVTSHIFPSQSTDVRKMNSLYIVFMTQQFITQLVLTHIACTLR
jgi:hypothetical protein